MKTKSAQAIKDGELVAILRSKKSGKREKEEAFNELYSIHHKQVYIQFMKSIHNAEIAEDLRQKTFQKVYEKINSYNKKYAFSTWLYKIANNTLIDHTRKATVEVLSLDKLSRRTSEDNDGMDFQLKSYVLDPEEEIVKEERKTQVLGAIKLLPNKDMQELLTDFYINEMSYKEISKKRGIDPKKSTIRVNVGRGIIMLAEIIEDQGGI